MAVKSARLKGGRYVTIAYARSKRIIGIAPRKNAGHSMLCPYGNRGGRHDDDSVRRHFLVTASTGGVP